MHQAELYFDSGERRKTKIRELFPRFFVPVAGRVYGMTREGSPIFGRIAFRFAGICDRIAIYVEESDGKAGGKR